MNFADEDAEVERAVEWSGQGPRGLEWEGSRESCQHARKRT